MTKFNITDKELAEALEITLTRLFEICDEFDSDPDDDWDLQENLHFIKTSFDSKLFSPEGAVEICNYLETNKNERPLLKRWKRWLLRRDQKLKGLMIAKKIDEIRSTNQIVFQQNRAFLAPRACREVLGLGTRQDILREAVKDLQIPSEESNNKGSDKGKRSDVEQLEINRDFFVDPMSENKVYKQGEKYRKNHYLSGTGLAIVAMHLSKNLTQKHRQEWAIAVAEYAPRALITIEKYEEDYENRISRIMERVRKQANGRCQITNRRKAVYKFNLEVHHLFDRKTYPQFADMEINLIAIGGDIHSHFHQWMGGGHVSCTVEDMEKYIEEFGNSLFTEEDATEQATQVAMKLSKAKTVLTSYLRNIA